MNRLEELLIILAEECAEVQQAASKCLRFGMNSEYNDQTNQGRLETELGDFMAVFKLILEEANLREDYIMAAAEAKLIKVERFMKNQKGLDAAELAEAFSRNPLPPISIEKPHRRKPRRKTR